MIEELKTNIVAVTFTKKNGDTREMVCTLIPEFLPEVTGTSQGYEGVTTVYDLEVQGWRSFRDDSVISYEVLEEALPLGTE